MGNSRCIFRIFHSMFDKILEVLGNSHFEAYVGGPIAGAIAGIIFANIASPPSGSASAAGPREVIIHITQGEARSRGGQPRQDGSDGSKVIAVALVGMLAVFLFSAFLPQIAFMLAACIATVAAFSITSMVSSLILGRFNTVAWWSQTVFPAVASGLCFYLSIMIESSVSPELVQYAKRLLGDGPITLTHIANGTAVFVKNVNPEYFKWTALQMAAFVMTSFATIIAALQSIHYVALSSLRSSQGNAWRILAARTIRYSGAGSIVTGLLFISLAWLLASGRVYAFLQP